MKEYIYIIDYFKLDLQQAIKIGSTKHPHSRLAAYQTYMFINMNYTKLYEIIESKLNCYQIDNLIQQAFNKYKIINVTGEGGTEWYQSNKVSAQSIENLFNINNIKFKLVNIDDCPNESEDGLQHYCNTEMFDIIKETLILKNKLGYINNTIRDYQQPIINYLYNKLILNNKIYLELATGSGKTFITFELLNRLKPDIIICFSPRTKINSQNISQKYLDKLENQYYPVNFSTNKNIKNLYDKYNKLIITCCTQSADVLYQIIKDINFNNIFIWFDEAHWGVEESWLDNNIESIKFWLEDDIKIKYRLFTSASPDNSIVTSNYNIFGELYNPIKVKDLIEQQWLCPIIPYIFETFTNDNINLSKYIIDNFTKLNKTYGLSFHSRTSNAYKLFKLHYNLYLNNNTLIKPYLIIGDNNQKVNEKISRINNNQYNFTNLNNFMANTNSIAYTVKKLDMGWDFKKLDFICFSDSKLSSKDIIQCIGRGTRPDKNGVNGKNLNKNLAVLLPIFINNLDDKTDFTQIINVLKYLILDIGLDIKKALINKNYNKETDIVPNNNVNYKGSDEIGAKILKLLGYKNNLKELYGIMRKNKIYNDVDYHKFINDNKHLQLKKQVYDYEGFKWKQVVDINGDKYYNTYQECVDAIKKIIDNLNNKYINNEKLLEEILIEIEENGNRELNKYNYKIPPYDKLKEYFY
ncbi:hypothetical protein crov384 [Cafeteria roenbergensis virus]|uniref:Uncharacterized protein n=1 Tax=Cafeteria roenbergensis virus (strain BV-PW1) TaxID=693272 RepID=E3T5F5_CROVB|nr:hypothetical protein crov384 [Cafeteria roenbergensis virus BV-PW1]ADO67418.1 hypothetical protein crov384 [Cafeteria roenbergensis virus BV-PW1]